MIKAFVNLPNIPKEVAFNAVSDLEIRRKWDQILANMDIVEVIFINFSLLLFFRMTKKIMFRSFIISYQLLHLLVEERQS